MAGGETRRVRGRASGFEVRGQGVSLMITSGYLKTDIALIDVEGDLQKCAPDTGKAG